MKEDKSSEWIAKIFIAMVALAMSIPLSAGMAFVLMKMWQWFITPLGVVPLGFLNAWGLYYLCKYMIHRKNPEDMKVKDMDSSEFAVIWIVEVLSSLSIAGITLLFGYIIKSFM